MIDEILTAVEEFCKWWKLKNQRIGVTNHDKGSREH